MCILGRSAIVLSRQPIRSRIVPVPVRSATMCDPHCEQKYRVLPGEDSKPFNRLSPFVQRNRSRGTLLTVEKAEPWVFRHVAQWQ
jgi:hypothetical protein